jgi:hypothetical protein
VRRNAYVEDWNENRRDEIKQLTSQGVLPHEVELKKRPEISAETRYVISFMKGSYEMFTYILLVPGLWAVSLPLSTMFSQPSRLSTT